MFLDEQGPKSEKQRTPLSTPAGWYQDPRDPSAIRWWDGAAWTAHTQSRPQEAPISLAESPAEERPVQAAPFQTDSQEQVAKSRPSRVLPGPSTFIVGGILALFFLVGILSGGIGSGLAFLGLGGVLTGLYVVITGRRSWAKLSGRKMGLLVLAGGLIVFVVGIGIYSSMHPAAATSQAKPSQALASPTPDVTKTEAPAPPAVVPGPTTEQVAPISPAPVVSPTPEIPAAAPANSPAAEQPVPAAPVVAPPPAAAPAPVTYKNCDAVRAAGKAPLLRGQPGYSSKLDADGDGVACEKGK